MDRETPLDLHCNSRMSSSGMVVGGNRKLHLSFVSRWIGIDHTILLVGGARNNPLISAVPLLLPLELSVLFAAGLHQCDTV